MDSRASERAATASNPRSRRRPTLLWIVALFSLLCAASQIFTQTGNLTGSIPVSPEGRRYLESWTILDKIVPYGLDALLMAAAVSLLALRSVAVTLYAAYCVATTLAIVQHALTTRFLEIYGGVGVAAVAFSLVVSLLELWYVAHLRSKGLLILMGRCDEVLRWSPRVAWYSPARVPTGVSARAASKCRVPTGQSGAWLRRPRRAQPCSSGCARG